MKSSRIFITLTILTNLLTSPLFAKENASNEMLNQRYAFLNAEKAIKQKDYAKFQTLMIKAKDYPLYPYLVYEGLKYRINHLKPSEATLNAIHQFEQQYPDFPFRRHLREAWLSQMAKKQQWALYAKGYQSSKNEEMQCYYHYAQYQVSKNPSHLHPAKHLWITAQHQPEGCDLLFRAWAKNKGLTHREIWTRFELALENKQEALAQYLIKILPAKDRPYAHHWQKYYKSPYLLNSVTKFRALAMPEALQTKMLRHTLKQFAKQDAAGAADWWHKYHEAFPFSAEQQKQISRDIAIYLAHQKNPMAEHWLKQAAFINSDPLLHHWQIRTSLLEENWPKVIKLINMLKPEEQNEPIWQYWRARSLECLNKDEEAKPLYRQLAKTRGYYGFLASLRLNVPISLEHSPIVLTAAQRESILAKPNMQRFLELRDLNRTSHARHEWLQGIENMSEAERPYAAKIAHQMAYYDLAINTINQCNHKNDVPLRFPLAYQDNILHNAKRHNIDPAWIFAIARQESTFHTHSVSPVGARGLMQLMPTSAALLSKKHNIPYASEHTLHEPQVNLNLGSAYLKQLQNSMQGSVVLATASYNAGPGQIRKWLPSKRLDADIWIETIPYLETREYVKNVISLTSIYRHRLGQPPAFAKLMQPINPKAVS